MIERPTAAQIEALSALEHNPDFRAVKEWLTKSLEVTLEKLMTEHDDAATRRAQGSAVDLSEILKTASNARNIIEKSKR